MRSRRIPCLIALALLPLIAVTACDRKITRVEQVVEPMACFNCHGDTPGDSVLATMIPARQQWERSRHASGILISEGQSSATCAGCHAGNGFIARATGQTVTTYPNPETIHCFVCHAPHTTGSLDLRWNANATAGDSTSFNLHAANLCAACHHARRSVNQYVRKPNHRTTIDSEHWGPHPSHQADILLAANAYRFPGTTLRDTPFHRTLTHDGCLDCHMRTTSSNRIGGHTFAMSDTLEGEEILNVAGCQVCHGDEVEDFNIDGAQDSVRTLVATLATRLRAAGLLSDAGLPIPQTTSQDSAGALWNYELVAGDKCAGVHNPGYSISMLQTAIDFLGGAPGKAAPAGPPLAAARREMVLPQVAAARR